MHQRGGSHFKNAPPQAWCNSCWGGLLPPPDSPVQTRNGPDIKGRGGFTSPPLREGRRGPNVLELLPASATSRAAVLHIMEGIHPSAAPVSGGAGSQPRHPQAGSSDLGTVHYKEILHKLELIDARTHKGRKPPAHVWEQQLIGAELLMCHDWGQWWMYIGGFKASLYEIHNHCTLVTIKN